MIPSLARELAVARARDFLREGERHRLQHAALVASRSGSGDATHGHRTPAALDAGSRRLRVPGAGRVRRA